MKLWGRASYEKSSMKCPPIFLLKSKQNIFKKFQAIEDDFVVIEAFDLQFLNVNLLFSFLK